jgi:hypothetical protein
MTVHRIAIIALAALLSLAASSSLLAQEEDKLFAPIEDTKLKDPDNPAKKFRIDFARVEHDYPLTRADLMGMTPENVKDLSQEHLDQLYGRLTAGPIPNGQFAGDLLFARGDQVSPQAEPRSRLEQILGGVEGRLVGIGVVALEELGRDLWKGKVFYRDKRILRNMIENKLLIRGITQDHDTVEKTTVPSDTALGRRFRSNTVWLLFPAKLYCGQSLVDSRRESIIVDYNYSDEVEGYRPSPDSLAGRGGLRVRDEIRMIRPGFYLGRAYINRIFLLNFMLYNAEVAEREGPDFAAGKDVVKEDCWPGEQARKIVVK